MQGSILPSLVSVMIEKWSLVNLNPVWFQSFNVENEYHFFFRSEKQHIKIPMDIEDAKLLGIVLGRYKDLYYVEVMFAVILVYILYPFIMPSS